MKKYMLKRILLSILSLLIVVMIVMFLVYSCIDRKVIFQQDDIWNKKSGNDRTVYEYVQYQKYGYLNYVDYSTFLKEIYSEKYGEENFETADDYKADKKAIQNSKTYLDNESVQKFYEKYEGKGYDVKYLEPIKYKTGAVKPGGNGYLLAVKENNPLIRLLNYAKGFFSVETTKQIDDPNLTDRYIRFEKDPYSGLFAIVGSGTQHKYLLYFDGRFPFIHQNFLHLNLGVSYTTYRGEEITTVINRPTGGLAEPTEKQAPAMVGTDQTIMTAKDFHTLTYNPTGISGLDEQGWYNDNYTNATSDTRGLSMLENSFVIGIISTVIAYLLGLPLGILMARRKDKLADKIGNAYIIFIMAVPSLAYIFMFAAIGTTLFHLPYKFANAEVKLLAYILPTVSLALPSIGSLMKWMRRYMIDQMNSDYVKFARAEGLSEKEIYKIHISKNAMIYIVHGIPGSILGCLTGAIITERAYAVPGVGNLLTTAINKHDNGVIVACTVFYTALSILSLILGDLLLAKYDPRISLSKDKGGGR